MPGDNASKSAASWKPNATPFLLLHPVGSSAIGLGEPTHYQATTTGFQVAFEGGLKVMKLVTVMGQCHGDRAATIHHHIKSDATYYFYIKLRTSLARPLICGHHHIACLSPD